jgi:HK97 family phage portal protein
VKFSLPRVFGKKKAMVNQTMEGAIPTNWDWNWWQQGKNPLAGGEPATVYACLAAYSQTIATLYGEHFKYDNDKVKTRIHDSAPARVLHTPNSYQTRSDLLLNAVVALLKHGNCYAVAGRDNRGEVNALHLVNSQSTTPYIEPESHAIFYALGANPMLGNIDVLIPQRDVLHIKMNTPRHPLVGVSPIEHAAMAIAANSAISGHQASFFNNMSRPSGVLSTDLKLNRDQMNVLRQAWEEQSKGMNSGHIPILGGGIKFEAMALSSQDAQMVEAFNMSVNDIARAFRVPLPLLQQHSEGSTYNNVEALISHWLSGGLGFLLEHVEQSFDKFFGLPTTERIEFDVGSLLRTDFTGRVDGYSKLVQGGLMTINEGRSKLDGLSAVENGDKPIVQQQMVPLGWTEEQARLAAANPKPAPAPPIAAPVDPEAAKGAIVYQLKQALNK